MLSIRRQPAALNSARQRYVGNLAPPRNIKDLDIRVEDNTLTIQGERKQRQDVPEGSYHRAERYYGVFTRSFSLPNTIDAGKIQAGYNNGVLRLTMAKREESKPRQIKVQVGR